MTETTDQVRAIAARGKTIVSASAGSGKTRVMVKRYVGLIASGEACVENMLAVTFTNKAAAQMRDRIRTGLIQAMKGADAAVRERLKNALRALPLAEISTIHAFCGRVIRTWFYLLGIDPAFRIVSPDDAEGKALSMRALDLTFDRAYEEGSEDFLRLLAVYFRKKNDGRLRDMVRSLLFAASQNADYRETLSRIAAGEEHPFEKAISALSDDLRRRAGLLKQKLVPLREEIGRAPVKYREFYLSVLEALGVLERAEDLFAVRGAEHGIPTSPRRPKEDPEAASLLSKLQFAATETRALYKEVAAYGDRETERERAERAETEARALAKLTLAFDDDYASVKSEAGVLDYGDLEHFALKLMTMPEVHTAICEKYAFIFVDEYQDVNPMQDRILSELTGDVFLVGDKKQAIYGFRGSDSRYFVQKNEAFARDGNCLGLNANFRSAKNILSAVNTVFSAALGDYVPMEGGALYGDYVGEVRIHNLEKTEKSTGERGVYSVLDAAQKPEDNPIAEEVLRIVREECGRKAGLGREWYDPERAAKKEDPMRPVRYGDIAVLVRKNTKAAGPIAALLAAHGIPVTASAGENICETFEVRLLLDWLSYLDDPEQDIPMASCMLSVAGGFTDAELARIRLKAERTLRLKKLSFRAACREYLRGFGESSDPLAQKLAAFFARTEELRALTRVRPASEMLAHLLSLGLEGQIAAKGQSAERLARVRRLIAESEGCGNTHAFLRRLADSGNRIDFSAAGGENAVHILTMHASKGLEFPVVILAELDEDFRRPDRDEVMWTNAFHIAPRAFDLDAKVYSETVVRRAAALSAARADLEGELNLLYVGMTRACCRLHMIFDKPWKMPADEEEEQFFYRPTEAGRLSDFVPRMRLLDLVEPPREALPFEEKRLSFDYRPRPELLEKIIRAAQPYPFEPSTRVPVKDSATGLMQRLKHTMSVYHETEEDDTMSEIRQEFADMGASNAAQRGTAYHAFLEHVRFGCEAKEELIRMQKEGLLTAEQIALLDEEKLASILKLPVFSSLAGKTIFREQRFLTLFPASDFREAYGCEAPDEVIYQGAVDLLIEEGAGRYTVVDYKFSSRSEEELRATYAVQMRLYRKTVAKAMRTEESLVDVCVVNIQKGEWFSM